MRRAPRALLSILAAASLLVSVPALAQSPSPVQVLDVEWTLSQLAGEAVPGDPAITATFATDGSLSGSGGCNDYSATWSSDGVTLTVTPVLATFKACSDEIDAREGSYFALIQDAASWSFDGAAITVTTNSGETLVFGDEAVVTEAIALVGDWTLRTVDGEAPPAGMVVTLSIAAEGTLTGAACNTYSATYSATQTGDLTVDPILATRMACGDDQDAFERSYLDGLQGATGWGTQIGKLTLFGAAELIFGDGSAADATLTGQEWSLVTISGAAVPDSGVTATFGEDGRVTGSGGCNGYSGTYTVDGESLSVGPLAATRMSCGAVPDDLERTYLDALGLATGFAISGSDLVISTGNGVTLEYSTSSGPVEPSQPPVEASEPPVEPSEPPVEASPEPSTAPASPGASTAVVAGDIVGTWKMTGYAGSALPGGMLAIDITFADDGSFSGFGGCNDYSGQWSLEGTSLSISGFEAASSGTCDQMTQGLEQGFFGLVPFLDTAEFAADGSLSVASSFAPQQGFTFVRGD